MIRRLFGSVFRALRRLELQDWVAGALLLLGLLAILTGVLPAADAGDTMDRVLPLMAFLVTVIVLAELVHAAEVFDVASSWLARQARGRPGALFGLCVALATLTTVVLNLDTTAVLLTPVLLALAAQIGLPALPFAMTAVWLANTASLLLPSSNLTNVLAAGRADVSPLGFAAQMLAPAVAAVGVTTLLLWILFWRGPIRSIRRSSGDDRSVRYAVPELHRPADPVLARVAVLACLIFVGMVLAGLPLAVASASGAVLIVAACVVRQRSLLVPGLIPWRLLVLVPGIFLTIQAVSLHGLAGVVQDLVGSSGGGELAARAAATGAGLSNVLNNLPAYLAGEGALGQNPDQQALFGLLIGVNVGPVITPWASLATLLWMERCRSAGVAVPMLRFVLSGVLLAVLAVAAATAALLVF